jgi:hypothetical protein
MTDTDKIYVSHAEGIQLLRHFNLPTDDVLQYMARSYIQRLIEQRTPPARNDDAMIPGTETACIASRIEANGFNECRHKMFIGTLFDDCDAARAKLKTENVLLDAREIYVEKDGKLEQILPLPIDSKGTDR